MLFEKENEYKEELNNLIYVKLIRMEESIRLEPYNV